MNKLLMLLLLVSSLSLKAQTNDNSGLVDKVNKIVNDVRVLGHTYITQNGPSDNTNKGDIETRTMSFIKKEDESTIKLSYTDNFRVRKNNSACLWEIYIDGKSCDNQRIMYSFYNSTEKIDNHRNGTLTGYCENVSQGQHVIQVVVFNKLGGTNEGDCHTGWNYSTWVLEAQEILNTTKAQ